MSCCRGVYAYSRALHGLVFLGMGYGLLPGLGCGPADPEIGRVSQSLLTDPSLLRPVLECVIEHDPSNFQAFYG